MKKLITTFIFIIASSLTALGQSVSGAAASIKPTTTLPSTCVPYSVRTSTTGISICNSSGNGWNVVSSSSGAVSSITGTANQVTASAATGAVTLSLPQSIATTSTPTFGGMTITGAPIALRAGVTNVQSLTFFGSTYGIGMDGADLVLWGSASQGVSIKSYASGGYDGNPIARFEASGIGKTSAMLDCFTSSTSSTSLSGKDTCLSRGVAGRYDVTNGSGAYRDIKLRQLLFDSTVKAGGVVGAQTINQANFRVNIAAAATTVTITNSLVTTSSMPVCTVNTNDTTAKSVTAEPASGSLVIRPNAAPTAEIAVSCVIF